MSLCIQIPKREDVKSAEAKITEVIHLKHTLELVEQLRDIIKEGSNQLFVLYTKVCILGCILGSALCLIKLS